MVEDDVSTRARVADAIRSDPDLEFISAYGTAGEVLARIAEDAPNVLLVDLGLPDRSGLEVIREVTARFPEVAVMVLTAFGDEANVLASLAAGAQGYLLKGNLSHDIGVDIRDLKNGGSPLSPLVARHLLARLPSAPAKPTPESEGVALTPREREILGTIARGFDYAETARLLGIAPGTVHTHLKRVYRKLAVNSKTEAVFEAGKLGLL